MRNICDKCYVGGHYIMVVKDSKFICLDCENVLHTVNIEKYREQRLRRCLSPNRQRLKTKNI